MTGTPRVRRLGLVPVSTGDESVRRYRLARLEEVSLSTAPGPRRDGSSSATRPPQGRESDLRGGAPPD